MPKDVATNVADFKSDRDYPFLFLNWHLKRMSVIKNRSTAASNLVSRGSVSEECPM